MSDTKQIWFVETEIVYKEVLDHVITNLNRIHNVDLSKRFWDIFIGAWLREFVELVMLRINECEHGQSHTTESGKISPMISLSDYRRLSQQTDFVEGLRFDTWSAINRPCNSQPPSLNTPDPKVDTPQKARLGRSYFSATYLNRKVEIALQLGSRRIPRPLKIIGPPSSPFDESLRDALCKPRNDLSQKSKIVVSLFPKYLPIVYLESFNFLAATKKPWTGKKLPRVIFTSNRHLYDDVFNFWTAHAVEHGTKLVIGQHGGYYGISEFPSNFERHEFDIADRYISWGWNTSGVSIAGPSLILVNEHLIRRTNSQSLVIVTDHLVNHPRSLFGDISKTSPYLLNIQALVNRIQHDSDSILIRIPKTNDDSHQFQIDWFNTHLPQTTVDTGELKFRILLEEAKLVVIPHNGTTLIESIALGVPTIIFWDKSIVWMRSEAEVVFNALEQVGIFHRTPESAASFINSNWNDIDGWWNSPSTIDARKQFTDRYARTVSNPVRFLVKALRF
jgi:putative transferase (TIGR04331 family)